MSVNPYDVVRQFEQALCDYTGAKYAVTVNSCTMALFLCCKYLQVGEVCIPKHTYVSVPMSIIHAGGRARFSDQDWQGAYQLYPYRIIDSARRFTMGMQIPYWFTCVSFHWSKILGIQQGGAILHDDRKADKWFRKARFDGRTEGIPPSKDNFDMLGWHCYMSPEIAAAGLARMAFLPTHNPDLPNDDYPDLSKMEIFK
jgi:dTDP-4-amino-4,6-dideoxygalactose transaminase